MECRLESAGVRVGNGAEPRAYCACGVRAGR